MEDHADVIEALRSATKVLTLVEQKLSQSVPLSLAQQPEQPPENPETKLLAFLRDQANHRRVYEEQDPESFRLWLQDLNVDLAAVLSQRQVYRVGPHGPPTVVDAVSSPALNRFDDLITIATKLGMDVVECLGSWVCDLRVRSWNDLSAEDEIVVISYETPAPISHVVPTLPLEELLKPLMGQPGAVDRVVSSLREEGTEWCPSDPAQMTTLNLTSVKAKWLGVVELSSAEKRLADQVMVVMTSDAACDKWWANAQAAHSVPNAALPLVRGNEEILFLRRGAASAVSDWAQQVAGFFEDGEPPLRFRNASFEDLRTAYA